MKEKISPDHLDRERGVRLWLGLLPFLLVGTAVVLNAYPLDWEGGSSLAKLGNQGLVWGYLVILAGLAFGVLKRFPRWLYPYLLYYPLYAFLLSNYAMPGIALFNQESGDWRAWALRAFAVMAVRLAIALAPLALVLLGVRLTHQDFWSLLDGLLDGLQADWTRMSFSLYGLLPFIVMMGMDEMDHTYSFPALIVSELILTLGAFSYLRQKTRSGRVISLLGGAFLGYLAVASAVHLYWDTHSINIVTNERSLLPGPIPLASIIGKSIWNALLATVVVLGPGIIALLVRWWGKQELHRSAPGES